MGDDALLKLLKEFIAENKAEHAEIRKCIAGVKNDVKDIEIEHAGGGSRCNNIHRDLETRMRKVEGLIPLEDIPKKLDDLAIKMYTLTGTLATLAVLAGWVLPILLKKYL